MYQFSTVLLRGALLLLALFHCLAEKSYAQPSEAVDSLNRVIRTIQNEDRFEPFYRLGLEYYNIGNVEDAFESFGKAQRLAYTIGDSFRIVKATRAKCQMLVRLNRTSEGADELLKVLPIAQRHNFDKERQSIINLLAIVFSMQANYDRSLQFHFENLVLKEKGGEAAEIRATLNNIGFVYFKMRNYPKAIEYYSLALKHDEKLAKSDFRSTLLINLALCYNQLRDYAKSAELIAEAYTYCSPECNDAIRLQGEFGLGVAKYGQRSFSDAATHFRTSLGIAGKIGDRRFEAENLIYLAHIQVIDAHYDSALVGLARTEMIASETGLNELLIETYKEYANIYYRQDDYRNASLYQQKYITLKDSIYSGELIDRIAKITTNFQERDNLKTIAAKEETIARQRSLNVAIGIIAILACALIFVLYRSIKINRRVNAALSDAKATIEDQNRQLRSSNVMLNEELRQRNLDLQKANDSLQRVNEELDNFIYKTSHDIRGPLASLKGMCNVALMDVKDPVALNYLEKLDITAEKLNTILTRLLIVNQINNSSLSHDRIDFEAIVDDILTLERKKGIPNRVRITREICPQTVFQADTQLVRIILENLIDNAIKFYNDSDRVEPFVHIRIGGNNQNVSIHVIDNGIGISEVHPDKIFQMFSRASERSETGGIGLYITKTAAEKLGGNVNLKTTPEGYTEFFVTLPQGR